MELLSGMIFLLVCLLCGLVVGTLLAQLLPYLLPLLFRIWDSFILMLYNMLKRMGKIK